MAIIGRLDNGLLLVRESVAGPNPYNQGARPTIVFNDLQQSVEAVLSVYVEALGADAGAYVSHNAGVSGRSLTVMVTGEDATDVDGAVHRELLVGDGVDLSTKNLVAVAVGR